MRHTLAAIIASLLLVGFLADQAGADGRNRRIGRAERRQMHRINEGVRSGELTRDEAKTLRHEQQGINQMRKDAKRDDGVIDNQERKELRTEQKDASKHIYDQKHDSDKRGQ